MANGTLDCASNTGKLVVLITGATGLVGAHIMRMLSSDETVGRILVATRRDTAPSFVIGRAHEVISMDLERDMEVPRGVDVVIHAAGEKRDVSRQMAVNAIGTRVLAENAARVGVRRFVHVSSVGVYGAAPCSGSISELQAHAPKNSYERSKDLGETFLREVCSRTDMEFVILQPTNIIAAVAGRSYPLLGLLKAIRNGYFAFFGRNRAWVNYIAVEDVASAVVASVRRGAGGNAYIINTPAPLAHVVAWICDELGIRVPYLRLPLWAGQSAVGLSTALRRITGRSVPFDRERLLELTNTTIYDPSLFENATGHRYPLGIETAIRTLVQYYRREALL